MLIGVISDTHIPERATKIPEVVFEIFKDVELILHGGDLVSMTVLHELENLAPTMCVPRKHGSDVWFEISKKWRSLM